jgi:signal transduction histidine kinase
MTKKFRKLWKAGLKIGFQKNQSFEEKSRLVITNGFCIAVTFIVLVFSFGFGLAGSPSAFEALAVMPLLFAVLWMNHRKKYSIASSLFVYGLSAIIFVLALSDRRTGTEYALLTVACTAPFLYRNLRNSLAALLFSFALFAVYKYVDLTLPFVPDQTVPYHIIEPVIIVICISVIFLELIQFQSVINRYSRKLDSTILELGHSNEELNSMNESLNQAVSRRTLELEFQKETLNKTVQELNDKNVSLDRAVNALSQRTYELDQVIYSLSHNIKTPLTSIAGLVHLIKIDENEIIRARALNEIETKTRELQLLLRSMNALSSIITRTLEVEDGEIDTFIRKTVQLYAAKSDFKRIALSVHILTNESTRIKTDFHLLQQVFDSLINNALTFRNETVESYLKISVDKKDCDYVIHFEDNGIGIDESFREQVFDLFFRGSEQSKGSGLGLYVCKEIVNKLKGNITVLPQQATGTTVELVLPSKIE